jgi:hypothetical protein
VEEEEGIIANSRYAGFVSGHWPIRVRSPAYVSPAGKRWEYRLLQFQEFRF